MSKDRGSIADFFAGRVEAERLPSDSSVTRRFVRDVVTWARRFAGVHTRALPEHDLPPTDGVSRFSGHRLGPSRFGEWGYVAFLVCTASTLAMQFDGLLGGWRWRAIGLAGFVVATLLTGFAFVLWQRAKQPLDVFIVRGHNAVTRRRLHAIVQAHPGGAPAGDLWIFARAGFSPGALQLGRDRSIRCLVQDGTGFADAITTARPTTRPSPAQTSPAPSRAAA